MPQLMCNSIILLITLSYVVRVQLLCCNFYILCYTAALLLYFNYYAQYYGFTRQCTPLTLQEQPIQLAMLYGSTVPAMSATNTLTSVTNSLSIHSLIAIRHTKAALSSCSNIRICYDAVMICVF